MGRVFCLIKNEFFYSQTEMIFFISILSVNDIFYQYFIIESRKKLPELYCRHIFEQFFPDPINVYLRETQIQ